MLPKFQLASQDALRSLGHLLPGAGQRRPRGQWTSGVSFTVFNHRGTFTLSTTGLSPMDNAAHRAPTISVPPKPLPGGHFELPLRLQLKDDLSSLIAGAQIAKPFHSKGMIKKTLHPAQLVPPTYGFTRAGNEALVPFLPRLRRLDKIPL